MEDNTTDETQADETHYSYARTQPNYSRTRRPSQKSMSSLLFEAITHSLGDVIDYSFKGAGLALGAIWAARKCGVLPKK